MDDATRALVNKAQSAAVDALNGLSELERLLDALYYQQAAYEVRHVCQVVQKLNIDLSKQVES